MLLQSGTTPQIIIGTNSTSIVKYAVRNLTAILVEGVVNSTMDVILLLPESLLTTNSSYSERQKGVHISASAPVYVISSLSAGEEITQLTHLALPENQINLDVYEYIAISHYSFSTGHTYRSVVLLIGNEDRTSVTVSSPVAVDFPLDPQDPGNSMFKLRPGHSHTVTLNRLQTLQFGRDGTITSDMTGTRILSSKPLTVISGNECAVVAEHALYCAPVAIQVPLVVTWGVEFLLPPVAGRLTGQIYKVVAAQRDTTVNLTCTYTINPPTRLSDVGSFVQLFSTSTDNCCLESDRPVFVVQLMLSQGIDAAGASGMVPIPSTNQYSNQFLFETLPFSQEHPLSHFLSILAMSNDFSPSQILYDGQAISDMSWSGIRRSNGSVVGYVSEFKISEGRHILHHSDEHKSLLGVLSASTSGRSYGHPIRMTQRLSEGSFFHFIFH